MIWGQNDFTKWRGNSETHLVERGHVGQALVDDAENRGCDLIMTGDSDSGLLTRVMIGSTSCCVLGHAKCSVLIVRDKDERVKEKRSVAELVKSFDHTGERKS